MPPETKERVRIYQLFVRLFGNINETRKLNGTLAENGVGKFEDINAAALASLKEMGFTHLWLTGVLQQATGTAWPGIPADDADLLKGIAGSPYAIKDCFDVCPDYARNPANRLAEFKELLDRIHAAGLKALIDFVPNHVARSYFSDVKPELSFGAKDDRTKFFDPQNNFFYLTPGPDGPPLHLPTGDGLFDGEKDFGRVTGNNAPTWWPSINDWYETVKLNYGWDFTSHWRAYPTAQEPDLPIPDTWHKMDAVIEYWQAFGVDGFRCDMAHMVPKEFWSWVIGKSRARKGDVYFAAEAYDNDPAKISSGNVMLDLLDAGFNAVYDDPSYKILKRIYDGPCWANDLDHSSDSETLFHQSLRYAENHDEVRIASAGNWGEIGMNVGRAVSGILFGMGRGPVMVYNGQEVGEPATGRAGFGGGNARTTIFDYWSMPELAKWVNGHRYDGGRLSGEQKSLRAFYQVLLRLTGEPAFRDGLFYPLNPANNGNLKFGSTNGDQAGGHWLYAFIRRAPASGQRFLVIANLHRDITFTNVPVIIPADALGAGLPAFASKMTLTERIRNEVQIETSLADYSSKGCVEIPSISPLTPCYFEIKFA